MQEQEVTDCDVHQDQHGQCYTPKSNGQLGCMLSHYAKLFWFLVWLMRGSDVQ